MKLKVIGWTEYDSRLFENGACDLAAREAIMDDIRKHGYEFTGYEHQEYSYCAPVLNDGKMRVYSQRGWGGLMAEAHGMDGPMDYVHYAFWYDENESKTPEQERDAQAMVYDLIDQLLTPEEALYLLEGGVTLAYPHPELGDREIYTLTPEETEEVTSYETIVRQVPNILYRQLFDTDLAETYTIDEEDCRIEGEHLILKRTDYLRYLAKGDTLRVGANTFTVTDLDVYRDVTEEVRMAVMFGSYGNEKYEEAVKTFMAADVMLKLTVK